MSKFEIYGDVLNIRDIITFNVYSISDNCDTLLGNIISLIKNIKRDSFDYEIPYYYMKYVTKDSVKLLCMNYKSLNYRKKKKIFITLTNDINLLIECLFYLAIKYEDVAAIEYLIINYANNENIKDICTECYVEPLKYIISNYYNGLSLKHLARRSIKNVCKYEDIDKLPLPRVLREYINNKMLKELFYHRYGYLVKNIERTYRNYLTVIQEFGLPNIVNSRLLVKGIKKFKCTIHSTYNCQYNPNDKNNYILYCEVMSYDALSTSNVKYVSITFHRQYIETYTYLGVTFYITRAFMNCEVLEQLPGRYDLTPEYPIYFWMTAGSFDENTMNIATKVFEFSEVGYPSLFYKGSYEINFGLFVKQQYTPPNKRKISQFVNTRYNLRKRPNNKT